MAKNKPTPKTSAPVRPAAPQSKQPQATVRTAKPKTTSSSWFRFPASQNKELLFDRSNYILFGVGAFLIILGFILMSGGNTDPKVFNEAEIYSFRRITLAPITVIAGFIVIIVAILKKPTTPSEG
jgi:hypothetical protein